MLSDNVHIRELHLPAIVAREGVAAAPEIVGAFVVRTLTGRNTESAQWSSLGARGAIAYVGKAGSFGDLIAGLRSGSPLVRSAEIDDLAERVLAARSSASIDEEAWATRLSIEASEWRG